MPFDIFGSIIKGGPQKSPIPRPFEREIEKKVRKAVIEKIDTVVSPQSTLGGAIHKIDRQISEQEEREENREKAPQNLLHSGSTKTEYEKADHLFIRLGPITHHGIFVGGNRVIHYSRTADDRIEIFSTSLKEFSCGKTIECLDETQSPLKYSREEAVRRAWSRIGEHKYHLFENNCENFVRWCRSGQHENIFGEN